MHACLLLTSYLLSSIVCGQSKRLLGADAPSHRPRGVLTKRHAGFQFHRPELAARLVETRACMSCFAFSGPTGAFTPSSPSSPGSMARSTASCSTCPEVGSPAAVRTRAGLPLPTFLVALGEGRFTPPHAIGPLQLLQVTVTKNVRFPAACQHRSTRRAHSPPTRGEPSQSSHARPHALPASAPCLPLRHACHATPNFADTRTLSRCSSPS